MQELLDDVFYQELRDRYKDCYLDYVLLGFDGAYNGKPTHKEAVLAAFQVLNARAARAGRPAYVVDEGGMKGVKCPVEEFLSLPEGENDGWEITSKGSKCMLVPTPITYWYAFLDPPYGNRYTRADFQKCNRQLFPYKQQELVVYRWNDDFSNYFDDGKEWWGTGLWSVYDKGMQRFVIIGASLTD